MRGCRGGRKEEEVKCIQKMDVARKKGQKEDIEGVLRSEVVRKRG